MTSRNDCGRRSQFDDDARHEVTATIDINDIHLMISIDDPARL
jgi:hypothetical protein